MRTSRSIGWIIGLATITVCHAQQPPLLIVQRVPKNAVGEPMRSDIGIAFLEEIKSGFRLNPFIWNLADPVFRDYVYNQELPEGVFEPTNEQVAEGARSIRAPFYTIFTLTQKEGSVLTKIEVFRTGTRRPAFTKEQIGTTQIGGVESREQAERSLARSWVMELRQREFKDFVIQVPIETPQVDPGPTITPDPPMPPPLQEDDLAGVRATLAELRKDSRTSDILTFLWEAVDARPGNLELRRMLVQALVEAGRTTDAIEECRRALVFWPGDESLRLMRIRGLLDGGEAEEAASEIAEALVRNPNSLDAQELRGDLSLRRGLLGQAREAYLTVLAKEPRPSVQFSLALTVGLEGDTAEAKRLISTALPVEPGAELILYRRLVNNGVLAVDRLGAELREVLRLGRIQPGNQNVVNRAQRTFKACEGLSLVFQGVKVPTIHRSSQDRRVLALKLLQQASAEILQFVRSGNQDAGDEASLSLGEALRQLGESQRLFDTER